MNHRIVTSTLALALTLGISGVSNAAVLSGSGASNTTSGSTKAKLVSFSMRNDAGSPLVIRVGEQQMTIEPGKTSSLKAPEGVQIVAVNAAGHIAVGDVLATVNKDLSGNTISIN